MPGGQASTPPNATANLHFDRNRYMFVTDQSRHLPVAMTLTVDQSHLHEVLVAIANSRLRFQTTQVEFRRVPTAAPAGGAPTNPFSPGGPSSERPPFSASGTPSGAGNSSMGGPPAGVPQRPIGPMPGGSSASLPGSGSASRPGSGSPPMPGSGSPLFPGSGTPPPSGATGAAPAVEPDNPNLVEVTIYGIASLYERPR